MGLGLNTKEAAAAPAGLNPTAPIVQISAPAIDQDIVVVALPTSVEPLPTTAVPMVWAQRSVCPAPTVSVLAVMAYKLSTTNSSVADETLTLGALEVALAVWGVPIGVV